MREIIRPQANSGPQIDGLLHPPEISEELAERSGAQVTRVMLEGMTSGSCNPAVGDVDGDGLDEMIVPWNRGEEDIISCYRGDGALVWEITDAPFYHGAYDDDHLYSGSHWHYRSRHRHFLTEVLDFDGDGELEVVVGLGPIHVLDATTGALKRTIDLDGLAMIWSTVRLDAAGSMGIVAGVNHHREYGSVMAVDSSGSLLWEERMPGMSFEDFLKCGDLTGDGVDEVGYSMADAERFEVRRADGELLWAKHVPSEVGDDTHVDDFYIGEVLGEGRQLLTSTGCCLFDEAGGLIWTLDDQIEHGQVVKFGHPPGAEDGLIYLNSKTERYAWGITPQGEFLWEQRNFSQQSDGRILLTAATTWADWSAPGSCEIVQSELVRGKDELEPYKGQPATLHLNVLDAHGNEVAKLPYVDTVAGRGFNGAMCCVAGHMVTPDRNDLMVLTHNTGELIVYSPM